jgi:hypothetical protein
LTIVIVVTQAKLLKLGIMDFLYFIIYPKDILKKQVYILQSIKTQVYGYPQTVFYQQEKTLHMKTLLIYRRLLIQTYTSEEISAMLLNLYIALADNDLQDIKSIIERFEITYEEIEQIQTLTNKLLTSN